MIMIIIIIYNSLKETFVLTSCELFSKPAVEHSLKPTLFSLNWFTHSHMPLFAQAPVL